MLVKYIGATDGQVKWGSNDDPRKFLVEGETYTLQNKEVHSWHTKYILEEFPTKKFNSVSFEELLNICPNCGWHFFTHNDDGSCVED